MYDHTLTVFNYHAASDKWYLSVISGADLIAAEAKSNTANGINNTDAVNAIIHSTADKVIATTAGSKSYTRPKAYAACNNPAKMITFNPECDFIYDGEWADLTPISDDDYDSGLYHSLNDKYDGVYLINSATFYSLLPHFEIGAR
ncbi:MAG: hypothetical protein LUD27_00635 [Clostridia bacterium]|nr:hypothetical protein [Clostridia bacterium]